MLLTRYEHGMLFNGDACELVRAMRFMEEHPHFTWRVVDFNREDGTPDSRLIAGPKERLESDHLSRQTIQHLKEAIKYLTRHRMEDLGAKEARYVADQLIGEAMRWKGTLFTKAKMEEVSRYLDESERWEEMASTIYEGVNAAYAAGDWPRFRRELVGTMEAWEKVKRQAAAWKGQKTRKQKAAEAA